MASISKQYEELGASLAAALAKGMEEGREAVERGEPVRPLSPEAEAWLERSYVRSWGLFADAEECP